MNEVDSIFDAFSKLSKAIHLENEINKIKQKLRESDTCGDCDLWMKSSLCPREKSDNSGYSKGPSMNGMICGKFVLKEWVKKFRQDKQNEMEMLKEELRQHLSKFAEVAK